MDHDSAVYLHQQAEGKSFVHIVDRKDRYLGEVAKKVSIVKFNDSPKREEATQTWSLLLCWLNPNFTLQYIRAKLLAGSMGGGTFWKFMQMKVY